LGGVEDGANVGCVVGAIGEEEEEVSASLTSRLWFTEIGCIAVAAEYHVAFGVGEDCIGMGGNTVKEVVGSLNGVFGGCGLS
jgi:hypothetical protein